jgi:hypothetical protein
MEVKQVQWFDEHFYKIETDKGEEFFPSPTTILGILDKPEMDRIRADVGNMNWDYNSWVATQKGSRVHRAVEVYLNGGVIIFNDPKHPAYKQEELKEMIESLGKRPYYIIESQQEQLEAWRFQQFFEKVKPRVIGSEQIVYSFKHKYAGTTDMVFDIEGGSYEINGATPLKLKGGRYILDLKTGKNLYDDYIEQIAAYKFAYEEMMGVPIAGGLIVWTNSAATKKGVPGLKTVYFSNDELSQAYSDFLDLKKVFDNEQRKGKGIKPKVFDLPAILEMK